MLIVVTVNFKEMVTLSDNDAEVVSRYSTKTFEDSTALADLAKYVGAETNNAMVGTINVQLSPDGDSWPRRERYQTI